MENRSGHLGVEPGFLHLILFRVASRALVRLLQPIAAWWKPALILLAAFIAYSPALNGGLLWDDSDWTEEIEPLTRDLPGLWRMWSDPTALQQYFPLTGTSFWIDRHLWGQSLMPLHIENVLLHVIAAVLLWRVLKKLGLPLACPAALLFAVHPMMAESVAWITERKNVLSMALMLAAALCWLRGGRVSSFVFFLAALLAKVSVFVLPPALLLIAWWRHGRIDWRRDVLPLVPHFIAALVLGVLVMRLETHVVGAKGADFEATITQRFFIAGHAPWFYLGKLLWPFDLCSVYPVRWQSWLPHIGLLIVPVVLFVKRGRWGRGPLACVLYFITALLPVLGFFNVYGMLFSPVADRWAYTASLAVFAGLAALPKDLRWVLFAITPVLIFLTRERARLHESQKTYWQDVLAKNPESWLARHGFGFALAQEGDMPAAITNFRLCLERRPQYARGWMNLGNACLASGEPREALKHLLHAVELEPGLPGAHYNLANCHLALGELPQAIAAYEKEIALGGVRDAGNNLAALLLQTGRAKEAAQRFEELLRQHPNHPAALANYAWLLATQADDTLRDGPRAVELARRAGDSAQALRSLAAAYAETGRFDEAVETLAKARAKSPSAVWDEEAKSYLQGRPFRTK